MRWIKTADRMPEDGQDILHTSIITAKDRREVNAGFYDEVGCTFVIGVTGAVGTKEKYVTHWMPFPEPPEE